MQDKWILLRSCFVLFCSLKPSLGMLLMETGTWSWKLLDENSRVNLPHQSKRVRGSRVYTDTREKLSGVFSNTLPADRYNRDWWSFLLGWIIPFYFWIVVDEIRWALFVSTILILLQRSENRDISGDATMDLKSVICQWFKFEHSNLLLPSDLSIRCELYKCTHFTKCCFWRVFFLSTEGEDKRPDSD